MLAKRYLLVTGPQGYSAMGVIHGQGEEITLQLDQRTSPPQGIELFLVDGEDTRRHLSLGKLDDQPFSCHLPLSRLSAAGLRPEQLGICLVKDHTLWGWGFSSGICPSPLLFLQSPSSLPPFQDLFPNIKQPKFEAASKQQALEQCPPFAPLFHDPDTLACVEHYGGVYLSPWQEQGQKLHLLGVLCRPSSQPVPFLSHFPLLSFQPSNQKGLGCFFVGAYQKNGKFFPVVF